MMFAAAMVPVTPIFATMAHYGAPRTWSRQRHATEFRQSAKQPPIKRRRALSHFYASRAVAESRQENNIDIVMMPVLFRRAIYSRTRHIDGRRELIQFDDIFA